jgi:hypothetical protein
MSGKARTRDKAKSKAPEQPTPAPADDLTQATAPEEFRRAITKDPYASIYRFDYDAARGAEPIDAAALPIGGDDVPRDGYYFDLDGVVVNYYRAGTLFPKYAPIAGAGGRYFFVTNNRNATTSDLLWIILRSGWQGNVLDIHVQ